MTAPIRWTRGTYVDGRLNTNNGLDLWDPRCVTAAVDRPAKRGADWMIRMWAPGELNNPVLCPALTQAAAKRIVADALAATLERTDPVARWQLDNILWDARRAESDRLRAQNAADLAEYDARVAARTENGA